MLDWAMRYEPLVEWLDRVGARRVLDVGSGDHGLSRYWSGAPVVQTDLAPMHAAGTGAGTGGKVQARAEALPFRDGAFDAVVSVDLLEHLAPAVRLHAIAELARVSSRHLALACPTGPAAQAADARLGRVLSRLHATAPPWLLEHQAHPYPTEPEVTAALSRHAVVLGTRLHCPGALHTVTAVCGRVPGLHLLPQLLDRRAARWLNRREPRVAYRQFWFAEVAAS